MKLAKKARKPSTSKSNPTPKLTPPAEPEGNDGAVDLEVLDRTELKAFIREEELEVTVKMSMSDDDIREAIKKVVEANDGGDGASGEVDDSAEGEVDDRSGEAAGDDAVDLSEMDRTALKAFIMEQGLDIIVKMSMSDDDIRKEIVDVVEGSDGDANGPSTAAPASSGKSAIASWLKTGSAIDEELKNAAASFKEYAPTFFVPDGESKIVRFRESTPVCALYMYSAHNGQRWEKFTQPTDIEDDLFARSGKKPALYLVYELFDRSGYVSKKDNKEYVNIPKLWLVSENVHKQLQHMSNKRGKLTDVDFEIHREGFKRPAYTIMIDDSAGKLPGKATATPRLSKNLAKYFAPPSVVEQRRLLRLTEDAQGASGSEK